jgi:arabinofuranosyltransferase
MSASPTPRWGAWLLSGLAILGYAVHTRLYAFLQDDAFIFFRYAEHLAAGLGPVWNAGERVEGYTSPAWMTLLALLAWLGSPLEVGAHVLSVGFGLVTLVLAYALATSWAGSRWAGSFALLLLAADRNFAVWSTSGMETRMFGTAAMGLALLVWRQVVGRARGVETLLLGPCLLLLSLARPEGILLSGLSLIALLVVRAGVLRRPALLGALAIWVGGLGAHLAWRLAYYGRPFPNTFYAKVSGLEVPWGLAYLADFVRSYPVSCSAFVLSLALLLRSPRERTRHMAAYLGGICLVYAGYLVSIGGDFMEFRMLDVLVPYAAVVIAVAGWVLGSAGRVARAVSVSALGMIAAAHLAAGLRFESGDHFVLTRTQMWDDTTRDWIAVGRWFRAIAEPGESIATPAAGAIPYYSGLRALDMLGLNDAYVASLPPPPEAGGVGHRKIAPDAYLRSQGITYVLRQPRLRARPELRALGPGEFYVEVVGPSEEGGPARSLGFLAVGTTRKPSALVRALRSRGVDVVTPPGFP